MYSTICKKKEREPWCDGVPRLYLGAIVLCYYELVAKVFSERIAAWTTAALRLQLIQVDRFVGLFATGIEVIVHELDNTRNASGSTERDVSCTLPLTIFESRRTFLTGFKVLQNKTWLNSSKRKRAMEV